MAKVTTRRVIVTAMVVDVIDIVTNLFVAIISGSAVMFVEMIAGVADFFSMLLLLIGNKRSRRRATQQHPFGFGKEQYFWATLAGFIILIITANLSFVFGWHAFTHPEPIGFLLLTYAVLIIAILTNGYAFLQCAGKLLEGQPRRYLWRAFMESWDLGSKTALVLDCMGCVSAIIGLISLVVYGLTGIQTLDGIGAMVMAVTLALFAVLLLVGTRSLITGQSVPPAVKQKIKDASQEVPEVVDVPDVQTMILGSESILANIDVHLRDDLTTDEIEEVTKQIKHRVKRAFTNEAIQVNVEITPPKRGKS